METLDSLILLGLLIYGIASARSKRKKRKARIHQGPPPLPPRSSPGPEPPPLPPRNRPAQANRAAEGSLGPAAFPLYNFPAVPLTSSAITSRATKNFL